MTEKKQLTAFGRLMAMLAEMERDLGLVDLSEPERRILGAVGSLISQGQETVSSRAIKSDIACAHLTDPTYYRGLKSLVNKGFIRVIDGRKTGLYTLAK